MIIVSLKGGHSNQLFQYAAGRRLAEKNSTDLSIDKHWFSAIAPGDTPRFYELGGYKLNQRFIRPQDFALVEDRPLTLKGKIYNLTKGRTKPRITHYAQNGSYFNEAVLKLGDNVYLDGYWQDERYFKDIRPILLEELELKKAPSPENKRLLKNIDTTNSVSVHIRRGDYVTNKDANKFHGLLDIVYYRRALDLLVKKLDQPKLNLFIFSNDIAWCKQNLAFNFPMTFIGGPEDDRGPEDMRLMKHCKHFIMANSSFSWWGAWLSQNPDKLIVAPKVWFQDKTANSETDIVPKDWLRL